MSAARLYAEYRPPPELEAFVECFWTREASDGTAARSGPGGDRPPTEPRSVHRVLPDGSLDLLLAAGGGWMDFDSGARAAPGAWIVGPMLRPQLVTADRTTCYTGVRFRPGAAAALLAPGPTAGRARRPPDAAALADLRVPLADLWGDALPALDDAALLAPATTRVAMLAGGLTERLARMPHPPPLVRTAVAGLRRSHGTVRIATLCAALGVTRQHLAREFARHVGVSPKMLARIERVRHVMGMARSQPSPNWSRLAATCGYADQAHLVDDFGELVGVTPARWLAS